MLICRDQVQNEFEVRLWWLIFFLLQHALRRVDLSSSCFLCDFFMQSEVQRHLSGASRRTSFLARQSDAAAADVTNVRVHAGDAFASVAGIARDLVSLLHWFACIVASEV